MIVICYIMGVPMISIHHTDNFVMCVAMIRNLGVMLGDNLCQFGDIIRELDDEIMPTAKAMVSTILK